MQVKPSVMPFTSSTKRRIIDDQERVFGTRAVVDRFLSNLGWKVDMRSISPKRLNEMDALFKKAVQRALQEENALRREGPELTADLEMVGDRPAGEIEPGMPIIQRALAAMYYFDIEPVLRTSSTDSNIPISRGIPAITISRGGLGDGGHSPDEWWLNQEGHVAMQIALLILVAEAGLINGSN